MNATAAWNAVRRNEDAGAGMKIAILETGPRPEPSLPPKTTSLKTPPGYPPMQTFSELLLVSTTTKFDRSPQLCFHPCGWQRPEILPRPDPRPRNDYSPRRPNWSWQLYQQSCAACGAQYRAGSNAPSFGMAPESPIWGNYKIFGVATNQRRRLRMMRYLKRWKTQLTTIWMSLSSLFSAAHMLRKRPAGYRRGLRMRPRESPCDLVSARWLRWPSKPAMGGG